MAATSLLPPLTTVVTHNRPVKSNICTPRNPDKIQKGTRISTISNNYVIGNVLGEGTFGKVFEAHDTKNRRSALKIVKRTERNYSAILYEKAIIDYLMQWQRSDDFFVKFYGAYNFGGYLCIIMERMDTDLRNYTNRRQRPLRLIVIKRVGIQISCALARLHQLGIIHTDLKPENIMVVKTGRELFDIKITDFGLARPSRELNGNVIRSLMTGFYRAPEVCFGLPCSPALDVWSLGCILAELYIGYVLFPADNNYNLVKMMMATVGLPSNIECGQYWRKYLDRFDVDGPVYYKMRPERVCSLENIDVSVRTLRRFEIDDLESIVQYGFNATMKNGFRRDDLVFLEDLHRILHVDAIKRPMAYWIQYLTFFK